jgi:hypothetical protein
MGILFNLKLKVRESGINEYLINSFHFLFLYYLLFGIVPAHIFTKLRLNA